MRIWFDTEFIDGGRTVDLLSIGLVKENGDTYYAEPAETDRSLAGDWVKANVLPFMHGPVKPRAEIAADLVKFCGPLPEFWAYYGSYDWVCFCQIFGNMMALPPNWPMMPLDLRQYAGRMDLLKQDSVKHNALNDAIWTRDAWLDATRRMEFKPK